MFDKKLRIEQIKNKVEEDVEGLVTKDILYGYHCNPKHPVPMGGIRIGIELESQRNTPADVVTAQVLGVSNCDVTYISNKGYKNVDFAMWDSTWDSTAAVEYVSRPIDSTDAPRLLQSIYSVSEIRGHQETGNHFHVNKRDLVNPDMFGLLCVYLAPELKDASRRNFSAWNTWCSCRFKSLDTIDEMIDSYFDEMPTWGHPLVRGSSLNPTMELRCFTTSNKLSTANKQVEAFLRIVNMSNEVAKENEIDLSDAYLEQYSVDFLESEFEDVCSKYDIYRLLSEIAED